MRCDKCRWWVGLEVDQVNQDGSEVHPDDVQRMCKRYPPVLDHTWLSECLREGDDNPGFSYEDYRHWNQPVTEARQWCGEFKAKK